MARHVHPICPTGLQSVLYALIGCAYSRKTDEALEILEQKRCLLPRLGSRKNILTITAEVDDPRLLPKALDLGQLFLALPPF